jgi:predicted negative regulator of RcsB-dependent stress response
VTKQKKAKAEKQTDDAPHRHTGSEAGDRAVEWFQHHKTRLTIGAVAVVLVGGGFWFTREAQVRRQEFASSELDQARTAADAGNFQLAASDLTRIVGTYGGTPAGQEAAILLANVRLQQGQPALAVGELREFLASGPDQPYVGSAAAMLASALEQLDDFGAAADAYQRAADATPYGMIRSQYLIDLGRVATTAGDTTRAVAAYQRVIDEAEGSAAGVEAKFRLAELRRR